MYSFGVMAIEVVRGNRFSAQILDRLRKVKEEGANILSSEFAEESGICYSSHGSLERQQMEMVLEMSLACCHPDPSCRPTVRQIVHALSSSANADGNPKFAITVTSELMDRYNKLSASRSYPEKFWDPNTTTATSSAFGTAMDSSMSAPSLTGRLEEGASSPILMTKTELPAYTLEGGVFP